MGHLSFRIPDSTENAIDDIADKEGISRSEVARELLIDGAKLRSGAPVLVGDGGAQMIAATEGTYQRTDYLLLAVLVVIGQQYTQQLLQGTAQVVAYGALSVIIVGMLVQWWRHS
ncbi:UNVERIFIED_CONTAM: hypothetical protein BEN50_18815 [Euhalothece sp. KZN 001]